jgi:hypothetical protein
MNRTMKHEGDFPLLVGYILGIGHLATKDDILFWLSVCATSLAIINYILQIIKTRIK